MNLPDWGAVLILLLLFVNADQRFESDAQLRQLDVVGAAQDLEVVQPLRRQRPRADDDRIHRRGVDEHRQRGVPAEDRVTHDTDADLARIVIDESGEPDVAAAREHLANYEPGAVAGAVDHDTPTRPALSPHELAGQPE